MLISELISVLTHAKNKFGNVEVAIQNFDDSPDGSTIYPVDHDEYLYVSNDKDGLDLFVIHGAVFAASEGDEYNNDDLVPVVLNKNLGIEY